MPRASWTARSGEADRAMRVPSDPAKRIARFGRDPGGARPSPLRAHAANIRTTRRGRDSARDSARERPPGI
eukprot:12383217-Alexandrium_andersonii.AAC.1